MSDRRPIVLAAVALVGLGIASYLTAFQLRLLGTVWDPLFGSGSERVLTSPISRLLPVPDASLGVIAYAIDAVLALAIAARVGPTARLVGLLATVASVAALGAIGLAILQPIVAGAFCSLCLASALLSVVLAIGALAEARDRFTSHHLEVQP